MNFMTISEEALQEFKAFLDENNVENYNVRINLAGVGWGGPVFNIVLDEQSDNDEAYTQGDITFVVSKDLLKQYGGFTILSSEENNGRGLKLSPKNSDEAGGCGSCGGGCH